MTLFKMKVLAGVLLLCVAVSAGVPERDTVVQEELTTAFDYHARIGIPEAARIKEAEESSVGSRIIGGSTANLGEFPYQAGLVVTLTSGGTSVCGAALLSNTRLVTAAHCWWDGVNRARQFVVVLGSIRLFSGGTRITTTNVEVHSGWNPSTLANDIAMIVTTSISYSNNIRNIALPGGAALNEDFAGQWAWATGFGRTSDNAAIGNNQALSQVKLQIITNSECQQAYGNRITASHLCTSGYNGVGTCDGDSGSPLAVDLSNQRILVGITSFGAERSCQDGLPAVFVRVTSYVSWIRARL